MGERENIAISTRIRLARNYSDIPFPAMMNAAWANESIHRAASAIGHLDEEYLVRPIADLGDVERALLVEKRLISPGFRNKLDGAIIHNRQESVSIMVNEEDHMRIQVLLYGLRLDEALSIANKVDDGIGERIDYAFNDRLGYLTSCPTNTGTGLRASVMLHLPMLTRMHGMESMIKALGNLGMTVRGLYGEGSRATGELYQLSNQVTLGRTEQEVLDALKSAARQIIQVEQHARGQAKQKSRLDLEDRLMRSYGTLSYAVKISTAEAMQLLSDVRLAADIGLIEGLSAAKLNQIMQLIQPAALMHAAGRALNGLERAQQRAQIIKNILL